MAHRPYPKRERALKQIERRCFEAGPAVLQRPLTEFEQQLLDGTATIVKAVEPMTAALRQMAPPTDEYRLSTR
ncbi:hypothetical protein [Streptomyces alanosinicus]|uniref:Uncharacterized protein n=1 Tax=Streptomyces alanosinicus TaxID=68171 RepID=A0A918YUT6_9ACTN|nr:hypothetical protein [Streptomyces alanosinicus]GHE16037.1 hypothetical protein GCM10010339_92640 [Streptomyces alanosinicus]